MFASGVFVVRSDDRAGIIAAMGEREVREGTWVEIRSRWVKLLKLTAEARALTGLERRESDEILR